MTANAITISSRLELAGLEKRTADAVASEIVDFNDEQGATKADVANVRTEIAELKSDIVRVETKMDAKFNILIFLLGGLVVTWFGAVLAFSPEFVI